MVADEMNDQTVRARAFESLERNIPAENGYQALGKMLKEWIPRNEPPSEEAINEWLEKLSTVSLKKEAEFYIGWYLHNRGLMDRAILHWKQCRDSVEAGPLLKIHAAICILDVQRKLK
jgi:hypothetical protein